MSERRSRKMPAFLVARALLGNRKIRRLTDSEFRCFFAIMAVAAEAEAGGRLLITEGEPATAEDFAAAANSRTVTDAVARSTVRKLKQLGTISTDEDGVDRLKNYTPLEHQDIALLPGRIQRKIEIAPSGCWEWTAARFSERGGYGAVKWAKKTWHAHRLVWLLLRGGDYPEVLHHECVNPPCVNPNHLLPTTHMDHPDGGAAANRLKTNCPHGHPLDGVLKRGPKVGQRYCKTCNKANLARIRAKKMAEREAAQ